MSLKRSLLLLLLIGASAAAAFWILAYRRHDSTAPVIGAEYAGSVACRECHTSEYEAWRTSHHNQAMQLADTKRVLGDFDNARFTYSTVTSAFFRRDGKFWVRTDAADGRLHDFEVKYTFGVTPLQQYLIELPDGRLQALSIAWDTRPKNEGGQRWFHLYPGEGIDHTDELHWTGRQQNWNFMCADCHSIDVRKGYDAAGDRFQTTWSELNVGCEACHGPGSRHVTWARSPASSCVAGNGLTAHLTERRGVGWLIDAGTHAPKRSAPRTTSTEINVCAQCHSRREQIAEGYTAGAPFEDYYAPSLITPGMYYADGQQRDEVFTYVSFAQSRMAQAGVTCADCHEPHSGRLRVAGNLLCGQCHVPAKYDSAVHHFHRPESEGAQCVSCHMPQTTYMVVDPRRDHSMRAPRPDLSVRMGMPNACSGCHQDRTARWADDQIRTRTGRLPGGFPAFAEAFHAAESNDPATGARLRGVADDPSQPAIVRASALARLGMAGQSVQTADLLETASRHITDPEPMVRRAALMIFEVVPPEARPGPVSPLLRDPLRSVRLQAAWVLAPVSAALAGTPHESAFARAADEFMASRRYRADRHEDRTTLGTFLSHLGRSAEAVAEYRGAIRLSPRFTPGYVNLSELQRDEGAEREAERTLREGLALMPEDAILRHALGLSLERSGRRSEAVRELERAAGLSPEVRFTYAYGVALHSSGRVNEAIETLERARAREPRHRDVLFALAMFHRDAGRMTKALEYAQQLQRFYPDEAEARALLTSLRSSRPRQHD